MKPLATTLVMHRPTPAGAAATPHPRLPLL